MLMILGAIALAAVVLWGFRLSERSMTYVSTDNAQVAGDIVQVSPTTAGRVSSIAVDVGDPVKQGQTLATVEVSTTSSLGLTNTAAGPVQGTQITAAVVSPVSGVVVERPSNVGSPVSVGQPLLSVIDVGRLWVTANISETDVRRVSIGQLADVHVDLVDATFKGKVIAITPATAATFFPPQLSNATGDYTKVVQLVPVKVAIDYAGATLIPGASAEVTIRVAN